MAIEAVFLELTTAFAALGEALQSLSLTVIEDRPRRNEVLLVDRLGDLVEDLRGWAAEGLGAAGQARASVAHPPDLHRARHGLGLANERFIRLEYRFFDEAVSFETIDGLVRFGRQRGGEWLGWSGSVLQGLDACRGPLRALDEALLQAWQELGERAGSRSLSLQTTAIGQQISTVAPPRRGRTAAGTVVEDELT